MQESGDEDGEEAEYLAAMAELDPLLAGEEEPPRTLGAPLTPLPPPMVPEVLPSAKVAAVKAVATRECLSQLAHSLFDICACCPEICTRGSRTCISEPQDFFGGWGADHL